MTQAGRNATEVTRRGPRGNVALAILSILVLFFGLFAALAPVAIERFRYSNDGALACTMGQEIPDGFDAYVDPVYGTFALFPARVDCRWQMADGQEVHTSRPISSGSTALTIACGGLGFAGLAVAAVRRAHHRRASS